MRTAVWQQSVPVPGLWCRHPPRNGTFRLRSQIHSRSHWRCTYHHKGRGLPRFLRSLPPLSLMQPAPHVRQTDRRNWLRQDRYRDPQTFAVFHRNLCCNIHTGGPDGHITVLRRNDRRSFLPHQVRFRGFCALRHADLSFRSGYRVPHNRSSRNHPGCCLQNRGPYIRCQPEASPSSAWHPGPSVMS